MLVKLRNLGKQTFVYGIGSVLNKLLGFILLPFYQNFVSIGNFGNLVYFETIILFLSAVLTFGIGPAHQRFFYSEKENKTYGIYLFNNFFGCFLLALVAILPVLFFSQGAAGAICGDSNQSVYLQITMWIVLSEVLYIFPLQILQYEEKPLLYLLCNAMKLILSFGLTIFFLVHLQLGYKGILLARLIGGATILLASVSFVVLPKCKFVLDIPSVIKSIRFGLPMVISNLGYTLFMVSDRFMLNWLSTNEEIGKYGFGLKIANFINLIIIQTIGMSYFPSVMSNESKENNIRYYGKMLTYYSFITAFTILGFLIFYKDILWIVGKNKDYWEGLKVVPILSLSFMIMGMNYFVGVGLFLKNQTKYYLIPSFSAASVNIVMNYFLIPKYGMMGAAFSIISAQIIYTSLLAYFSAKQMKINFEWGKIFLIYLISISFFEIYQFLRIDNFWIKTIIGIAFLTAFPIVLYILNFFEAIEIQRLKEGLVKFFIRIKNIL